MLDAAELAQIQADAAAATCDLPCQIERWNSVTQLWPVVSLPGLLCGMAEPQAATLANYEYMVGDQATWHVRFPFVTDVRWLDRLVITGKNGTIYTLSVVKLLQPRSYAMLFSVLATE